MVGERYCISANLNQDGKAKAGNLSRVAAVEIEALVVAAVRKRLDRDATERTVSGMMRKANASDLIRLTDKSLIAGHVLRVDVKPGQLAVTLKPVHESQQPQDDVCGADAEHFSSPAGNDGSDHLGERHHDPLVTTLRIPWTKKPSKLPREIIRPSDAAPRIDHRPTRAETRAKLVAAIAKGRHWLDEIVPGNAIDVEQIAKREKCSIRQVNMTVSLAFLAPSLIQAAIDGRLPRGIGVANLRDAPAEWSQQLSMLGLSS